MLTHRNRIGMQSKNQIIQMHLNAIANLLLLLAAVEYVYQQSACSWFTCV